MVEQSSAVIGVPNERASPLWVDHREICRFESEHSDNYKHVLAGLQVVAESALNQMKDTASTTGTNVCRYQQLDAGPVEADWVQRSTMLKNSAQQN